MKALRKLIDAAHVVAQSNAAMKAALDDFYEELGPPVELTPRQRIIFEASLDDKTLEEISAELGIAAFSARRDSKNINEKFGVKNRHAALLQFMRLE